MKNTFGNAVSLTIFGESHGAAIGAVLDGLAAGLPVSRAELVGLGHGGLCLGCGECHYPICPFGK